MKKWQVWKEETDLILFVKILKSIINDFLLHTKTCEHLSIYLLFFFFITCHMTVMGYKLKSTVLEHVNSPKENLNL